MMNVIPDDLAMVSASSLPFSVDPVEVDDSAAPRRVSFRTNEVEYAKEMASLLECHDDTDSKRSALHVEEEEEEEEEDCQRGFELKRSMERQHRKFTIIKSIVKNQNQCGADHLGKLARACSRWAMAAARVQAQWDFEDAYFSGLGLPMARTLPSMENYPMPLKKRRTTDFTASSEERRKKRAKHA
jgi:hypothetical protein